MAPAGWLRRQDIVVERLRPQRHGDHYVLREWDFLSNREFFNCGVSDNPVFTPGTYCPELAEPPPEAIRQVRRTMRVDYGKIDYALATEASAVLYDVNKTIGVSNRDSPLAREIARMLAGGLCGVLEG